MTVLERAASAEVVDDIVLPFAVESLSTRGRLVRLGPAIDQLLKRHDYPEPVVEAGGGSGRARRPARIDPEDERPVSVADQKRRPGHYASGRFRRAVAFARARAVRPDAGRARFGGGRRLAWPGPYGLHRRSGRRDDPLPGRDRARGSGIGSCGASLFRALGADPDLGASRGRRDRHRRAAPPGAPAGSSSNTCRRRADGGSQRISTPATRPRASSRTASRRMTPGPRPRLARRPPKRTN